MRDKVDPGKSFLAGGGGPVLYARDAEEYNRMLGQELTGAEERTLADLVYKATVGKSRAWE